MPTVQTVRRPNVTDLSWEQAMRGLKPPRFPTVFEALVNGRRLPAAFARGGDPTCSTG